MGSHPEEKLISGAGAWIFREIERDGHRRGSKLQRGIPTTSSRESPGRGSEDHRQGKPRYGGAIGGTLFDNIGGGLSEANP